VTLVRIAKDWDWPDLLRQTPGGRGIWDGIRFTVEPVEECDYLVFLNNRMKTDLSVRCPEGNVWALMQEPYVWGFTDWMVEGHHAFSRVYTNHVPSRSAKYVASHPALPWHVLRTFDELTAVTVPPKPRKLSWIVGNCRDLPGHMKRLSFLRFLQRDGGLPIDLYGRAVRYIEDKWEGLGPYRYSIAVENASGPDYWTEKIADCFLTWTVPLYHGCPNLERYFPPDSFLRIDIDRPREAVETIRRAIAGDDWERRLPALEEARNRVLRQYQLFPYLAKLIHAEPHEDRPKVPRILPAYRRSLPTELVRRPLYKVRKHFLRFASR
jgi:hypothetical protein